MMLMGNPTFCSTVKGSAFVSKKIFKAFPKKVIIVNEFNASQKYKACHSP